jgi:hypothetical protein
MIVALFVAGALFAQATPAAASAPGAPSAAPPAAGHAVSPVVVTGKKPDAADRGSELVCRSETVLGTLFPKRICMRRDELAQRTREDQKETREATNLRPWRDEATAK